MCVNYSCDNRLVASLISIDLPINMIKLVFNKAIHDVYLLIPIWASCLGLLQKQVNIYVNARSQNSIAIVFSSKGPANEKNNSVNNDRMHICMWIIIGGITKVTK